MFANTDYSLNIYDVFYQSFITAAFGGGRLINTPLWTITFEIYGSFLVFALLAIFSGVKIKYYIYAICFLFTLDTPYCAFIFGLIMNSLFNDGEIKAIKSRFVLWGVIAVSLFLISYPYPRTGVTLSWLHSGINLFGSHKESYTFYVKIGCFLLFYIIMTTPVIQSIFSGQIAQFFGRISFSIYILHITFLNLIKGLNLDFGNNITSFVVNSLLSFSLSILFSVLFEWLVDKSAIKITNKTVRKIMS